MKNLSSNSTTVLSRWTKFISISRKAGLSVVLPAFLFIAGCKKDDTVVAGPITDHSAVNLHSASSFAIIAKSGVSATGVTSISGDIGLSPAAASYVTGFGLIMDATNTFSTSALVVPGKIYASDYTPPTPSKMTTAVSDMEIAYTDAAGRTSPDHIELGAGNITSMTLAPGLYKWGTGVLISAAGVTLSGSANDVWIFQISQDLTVANGAIITLSGGAHASNIFWQVAGQTTIGTTVAMKGIILCKTAIAMNTGATLNGRAMAQTAVTLAGNTVVIP
ncbi:MAG: ice-binding family protein [Bacteroidota bacterium]|nr:ice-binding family protein [Bacteroidota bacterium]